MIKASDFVMEGDVLKKYVGEEPVVVVPDGVTKIEKFAFKNCANLKNITLPNGVTSIGDYAFQNCKSLTSITLPDGVTSIGYGAFAGCKSLASILRKNRVSVRQSQ